MPVLIPPGDAVAGDVVFDHEHVVDERQLFLFSAASHNAHRIHYDREYARSEGYTGLIVHGPLQRALMAMFVRRWAGRAAFIARLDLRHQGFALAGESLTFRGTLRSENAAIRTAVTLDVAMLREHGNVLMRGTVTVGHR